MTGRTRLAVVFLFAVAVILAAANLLWTSHQVNHLRAAVQTQCKFDADIGSAPIKTLPHTKPSLLGVTIVSDSRVAWHGLGCPGALAPAAPSFTRWAKAYHLPEG